MSKPVVIGDYALQTGKNYFDFENPEKSTMTLEDMVAALSNICRWGGHCHPFFSVAQHACLVSDVAYEKSNDAYIGFMALHHDDHESVRGDIPTPRKRFLKAHGQLYKGEEIAEDTWIFGTLLGVRWPMPEDVSEVVKWADAVALATEKKFLKPLGEWSTPPKERPKSDMFFAQYLGWDHDEAYHAYLVRHERLATEMKKKGFAVNV